MTTLTVTAKGQVTLRKEVLHHLGIAPGGKLEVDMLPDGSARIRGQRAAGGLERFFGSLHVPGERAHTIEEINEVIRKGWAGEL